MINLLFCSMPIVLLCNYKGKKKKWDTSLHTYKPKLKCCLRVKWIPVFFQMLFNQDHKKEPLNRKSKWVFIASIIKKVKNINLNKHVKPCNSVQNSYGSQVYPQLSKRYVAFYQQMKIRLSLRRKNKTKQKHNPLPQNWKSTHSKMWAII